MKRLLLLITIFSISFSGFSEIVSQSDAEKAAKNLYFERVNMNEDVAYKDIQLYLAYTELDQTLPLKYYFNEVNGKGFVIVSAEDRVVPILAYSFEGNFDIRNTKNTSFTSWMNLYSSQIQYVREHNLKATPEAIEQWSKYLQQPQLNKGGTVGPLIETQWDQGQYYNTLCPGGSVTGCVATMMAQTIRYFKHPAQGSGSHTYNSSYGQLTADFGSTMYNYNNMPAVVNSPNNDVATLMYHCGVSVEMNYSPGGSGANMGMALSAMSIFFKYSPHANKINKNQYTDFDWKNIIRAQLMERRPIMYSGPGHAFICDGFQYPDYFHFNWGWGGSYDGYFYLTSLTPGGGYNFTNGQDAMIDLFPLPTDIDEENLSQNKVFPNPVVDEININLNENITNASLTITDLSGRVVHQELLNGQIAKVSLNNIANGTYLISVIQDGQLIIKEKLIKL